MVNIPDQPAAALLFDPINADIDHHRSRLDHVGRNQPGPTNCGYENVSLPRPGCQIAAAAVAKGDSGITTGTSPSQQESQRLANDIAAADDHGVTARRLDFGIDQHPLNASRCAGNEPRSPLR
jgi:hypothetical protein